MTATKDEEVVATLTIKRPGAMTASRRLQVAAWLQDQARDLAKHDTEYTDTGSYRARFWAIKKARGK